MPLTKKGKKIMTAFLEEYGKKRGKSIFYAWENKYRASGVKKN